MIVHARLKKGYGLSTLNRRQAIISPTLLPSLLFPLLPLAPNALSLCRSVARQRPNLADVVSASETGW
jgi:hypothetical protein